MDRNLTTNYAAHVERQLSQLKIISRLLAHEVNAQTGQRLNISREQVGEIQTAIDLFIESVMGRGGSRQVTSIEAEPVSVTRVN
jgi:hypothetical protein